MPRLAAVVVAALAAAAGAQARPYWADPAFEAGLGLPAADAAAGAPAGPPLVREAGRMRLRVPRARAALPASNDAAAAPSLLGVGAEAHRAREPRRPHAPFRSLADRLGFGGDAPGAAENTAPLFRGQPRGLEPPMSYGDAGAFARFREQAEGASSYRREAVEEGPFGGAARAAPVAHRSVGGGRFEAPAFAEVMTQMKEIVRDPRGHAARAAASERHLVSSTVDAPRTAPPMRRAPPSSAGRGSSPPIPRPTAVLMQLHDEELKAQHAAKVALVEEAAAAPPAPHHRRRHGFKMELNDDARLPEAGASAGAAGSLLEATAQAKQTEDPLNLVHRLTTEGVHEAQTVKLPAFKPMKADDRVLANPYVRYD